jgi:hypothetical protein
VCTHTKIHEKNQPRPPWVQGEAGVPRNGFGQDAAQNGDLTNAAVTRAVDAVVGAAREQTHARHVTALGMTHDELLVATGVVDRELGQASPALFLDLANVLAVRLNIDALVETALARRNRAAPGAGKFGNGVATLFVARRQVDGHAPVGTAETTRQARRVLAHHDVLRSLGGARTDRDLTVLGL